MKEIVYLNSGMSSRLNKKSYEKFLHFLEKEMLLGGGHPDILKEKGKIVKNARLNISKLLNCSEGEVVLTPNTTYGLNIVVNGLDWKEGDEILITNHEHYSCLVPIYQLEPKVKIKMLKIESCLGHNGKIDKNKFLNELKAVITEKTKLFFLSHILYTNGITMPLEVIDKVANQYKFLTFVDGAQTIGHINVDLSQTICDFYSFTGGKWLNGPTGTGGLYINKKNIINNTVQTSFTGWASVLDENPQKLKIDASKYEVSTINFPVLASFSEAINYYFSIRDNFKNLLYKKEDFEIFLKSHDFKLFSYEEDNLIISFKHKFIPTDEIFNILVKNNIITRKIDSLDCIRVTIPLDSDEKMIIKLKDVLKNIIHSFMR
ncbi:aminotransferase class V-fold PLP-dependent enzyme [Bacillus cereus]|nr:aminotransferase class V-fold PLP-dependent enzyme [Bacillus cereus]